MAGPLPTKLAQGRNAGPSMDFSIQSDTTEAISPFDRRRPELSNRPFVFPFSIFGLELSEAVEFPYPSGFIPFGFVMGETRAEINFRTYRGPTSRERPP